MKSLSQIMLVAVSIYSAVVVLRATNQASMMVTEGQTLPSTFRHCHISYGGLDDLGYSHYFNLGRVATHAALEREFPGITFSTEIIPAIGFRDPDNLGGVTPSIAIPLVRDLISSGCNIVFSNSAINFGEDPEVVAARYPNVSFVVEDLVLRNNANTLPNLRYASIQHDPNFYIAGATAAAQVLATGGSCVGFMASWYDFRQPKTAMEAFATGVRSVSPTLTVYGLDMKSWFNPLWENIAISALQEQNCTIFGRYSDPRAVDERIASDTTDEQPQFSIGVHGDVSFTVGDSALMSTILNWTAIIHPFSVSLINTGNFPNTTLPSPIFFMNRDSGCVVTSELSPSISPSAQAAYDTAVAYMVGKPTCFCGTQTYTDGTTLVPTHPSGCLEPLQWNSNLDAVLSLPNLVSLGVFADPLQCGPGTFYSYAVTGNRLVLTCNPCGDGLVSTANASASCQACENGLVPATNASRCVLPPVIIPPGEFPVWGIALLVIFGVIFITIPLLYLGKKHLAVRNAPKDAKAKTAVLFVGLKQLDRIVDRYPDSLPEVTKKLTAIVNKRVSQHGCYTVKLVGSTFLIVASSVQKTMSAAIAMSKDVQSTDWIDVVERDPGDDAGEKSTVRGGGSRSRTKTKNRKQSVAASIARSDRVSNRSDRVSTSHSETDTKKEASDYAPSSSVARRALNFELAAAMHFGKLTPIYEENANRYDYAGDSIDKAAIIMGTCASSPMSLMCSQECMSEVVDPESFQEVRTKVVGKLEVMILAHNPDNRTYDFASTVQGDDGELLANLQQERSGMGEKRFIMLYAKVHGLAEFAVGNSNFVQTFTKFNTDLEETALHYKGFIHQTSDMIVISFGAVLITGTPLLKAVSCALDIQELVKEHFEGKCHLASGVGRGRGFVGHLGEGSDTKIVGEPLVNAEAMYRKCLELHLKYPGDKRLTTVLSGESQDELSTKFWTQYVGVETPSSALGGGGLGGGHKVTFVAPMASKMHSADNDMEWMYELEHSDDTNIYRTINKAYKEFVEKNDGDEARRMLSDIPVENREKLQIGMGELASVLALKS